MATVKSKIVYDNKVCKVRVDIRPDSHTFCMHPVTKVMGSHNYYAEVFVFACNRSRPLFNEKIYPWPKFEDITTGWWRWKTTVRHFGATPEEQLNQMVIDCTGLADKYKAEYLLDLKSVDEVLEGVQHVLDAKAELQQLVSGLELEEP